MADEKIQIEIELDDGSVKQGFLRIEKQAKTSAGKVGKSFGSKGGGIGGLAKNFALLTTAVVGLGAVAGGVALFGRSVREAVNQQESVNELNTALAITGKLTPELSQSMQTFASSLQETTTFGDDLTLSTAALIQSLGNLDEKGLKRSTKAALDLATSLKIDVKAAATLVGKAATGEVTAFTRYGIAIKKTGDRAKDFATALNLIESKFGGSSEKALNTFSNRMKQLQNNFGDLLEEFGNLIIKSPVIVKLVAKVSSLFLELGKSLSGAFKDSDPIGELIIKVIKFGEAVNTFVVVPLELAFNVMKIAFAGMELVVKTAVDRIIDIFGGAVDLFAPNSQLAKRLEGFHNQLSQGTAEAGIKAQDALDGIFSFNITSRAADFMEALRLSLANAAEVTREGVTRINEESARLVNPITEMLDENIDSMTALNIIFESMRENFELLATSGFKNFQKLGQTMTRTLAQGAGNAFASFGKALATGENALEAFANSMLKALGGAAVQMGSLFILQGLAYTYAGMANGPPLIAAGAGLAIIGGLLSAIGPTAGSTSTAGGAGGSVPLDGPDISTDEIQEAAPLRSNEIVVNISGDVLDSDESGMRIAELLQNEIDRSGTSTVAV